MNGWPRIDANSILTIEIVLMLAILTMNATDQVLQHQGPALCLNRNFILQFIPGSGIPGFRHINT